MPEFRLKIAGHTALVRGEFESTPHYFKNYLTEEPPETHILVTKEDRAFQQREFLEEARLEGIRPRIFPEPFLERSAIQRKMAEFLFDFDILMLHGSTVAVDGEAYLFTAKCGTGKSTHTRLWRQVFGSRAVMVNDDKPFLSFGENCVTAHGSPWSGKHGLDTNLAVPLKGICILERGTENKIQPADRETALSMLLHQGCCPLDKGKEARYRALVEQLCSRVKLWQMTCNMEPEAAVVSHSVMSG